MTKLSLVEVILDGLRLADSDTQLANPESVQTIDIKTSESEEDDKCLSCGYTFLTRDNQVEHYKSDWHRYNLKLRLSSALPVTENQFEDIIDEISSISGSESENDDNSDNDEEDRAKIDKAIGKISEIKQTSSIEDETYENYSKRTPKLHFRNSENQLLSVYKCILPQICDENEDFINVPEIISSLKKPTKCCIILLSAGHFAAAVFEEGKSTIHKTYHRYILRAKQGSVQSVRDNTGHAPKSGGATLRRYNEMALGMDIQSLLNSWEPDLSSCTHIFLRAPHYNKSLFYNGKAAPFDRKDPRIRGIPLPTRRPTFNELNRVYKELYSVEIHDDSEVKREGKKKEKPSIKSKTTIQHPEENLKNVDKTALFGDNVAQSPNTKRKKQKRNKNKEKDTELPVLTVTELVIEEPVETATSKIMDELYTVCKVGDLDGLKAVLASIESGKTSQVPEIQSEANSPLNQPIGKEHDTSLHIAAKAGQRNIAWYLLESGANPALKNSLSMVPYSVASDKPMRNMFRKFKSENPDMYDYKSSLIPAPLTDDMEKERSQKLNKKKKAQRALKKERSKAQNEEKTKKELEQQEIERFASLSDREKRAIAAERRLAKQIQESSNSSQMSVKRCWLCGQSRLGKIPFEYFDFQFCTITCLKKHKALESANK